MSWKQRLVPYLLLGPGLLWLLLFFVVPMFFMGELALYSGSLTTGGFEFTWAWANFPDALSGNEEQIVRSFFYAGTATVLALLIGYPLAYAIAFRGGKWRNALLLAVILPFFVTYLVRTLSWQTILDDDGVVVDTFKALGFVSDDGRLLATTTAVVAGITYNFLPFMILPLYASLEKLDHRLLEAGADLYATPFTTFRLVTLPLAMPGLVAGTLLTFIPASGDYINAALLGTPQQYMVGNRIQAAFLTEHNYPLAASLSLILMGIVVLMVVVYVRRVGTAELV